MPTKEQGFLGEQYLKACRKESLQVLHALKIRLTSSRQFPEWVTFLEVIPTEAHTDGTFATTPCVVIGLKRVSPGRHNTCPTSIFNPGILPDEPLANLSTHEAEQLTLVSLQHEQPLLGQSTNTRILETTAISRRLLASGVPLVAGRTTDGKRTACIVPLVPNPESHDLTGDQYLIDRVRDLAYAGVTQGLTHEAEV